MKRIAILAFAAACAQDVILPSPGVTERAVSEAQFPLEAAVAYCRALAQCCDSVEVASCENTVEAIFEENRQLNDRSYLVFRADWASDCLAQLNALECPQTKAWNSVMEACTAVYDGTTKKGELCTSPRQCSHEGGVSTACSLRNGCVLVIEATEGEACSDYSEITMEEHICAEGLECKAGVCQREAGASNCVGSSCETDGGSTCQTFQMPTG